MNRGSMVGGYGCIKLVMPANDESINRWKYNGHMKEVAPSSDSEHIDNIPLLHLMNGCALVSTESPPSGAMENREKNPRTASSRPK